MNVGICMAHPDDESWASGALVARLGRRASRVFGFCATSGEQGADLSGAGRRGAALASVRRAELRSAFRALLGKGHAVKSLTLHLAELPDGALGDTVGHPSDLLLQAVAGWNQEHRPDLLIGWGPAGGYGHRDHIALHRALRRCLLPHQALLGASFPAVAARALHQQLSRMRHRSPVVSDLETLLDEEERQELLCVPVGADRPLKEAALRAHASQLGPHEPSAFVWAPLSEVLLCEERYLMHGVSASLRELLERA